MKKCSEYHKKTTAECFFGHGTEFICAFTYPCNPCLKESLTRIARMTRILKTRIFSFTSLRAFIPGRTARRHGRRSCYSR
jgi:hypothetical protein